MDKFRIGARVLDMDMDRGMIVSVGQSELAGEVEVEYEDPALHNAVWPTSSLARLPD